jgi:uncharacterized protein involved in type VI secretion and phage assembly
MDPADPVSPWPGVYPALVTDIKDPDGQGRVKVTLPLAPDPAGARYEAWARLATLMAGQNRGTWFIPEVDDEVLVAFEGGDPGRPFVIGALWNGKDKAPLSMDGAGHNNLKSIITRNGLKLEFSDSPGQEQLRLLTPGGNKLVLKDGPGVVTIEDSNGNVVRMDSEGIALRASKNVRIDGSEVAINATKIKLNAGTVECSNEIKGTTVNVKNVIADSYTPGSGNIW